MNSKELSVLEVGWVNREEKLTCLPPDINFKYLIKVVLNLWNY